MTKNRSKMLIIFLTIILVVGLVASFVNFTYPFSVGGVKYKYSSFINELVLGSDINDSVLFEYQAKVREDGDKDNYNQLMSETINGLGSILNDSGFKNSTIVRLGEDGIRVEVGGIVHYEDAREVISLISSPAQLFFRDASDTTNILADSGDVKNVKVIEQATGTSQVYGVQIEFTTKGYNTFKSNIDKMEGDEFEIVLGEQSLGSLSKDNLTSKYMSLYSETFIDHTTANQYAIQMRTGLLPLELIYTYNSSISASAGIRGNVANPMLYIWVSLGIMVIASLIFFIIRYKQIGAMAMFNMLFYIVLGLFFLQSVPLVHINLSGIFAIVVGYILAVMALISTLENAKQNYAKGKKLHTSLKQGINSSVCSTLTTNIMFALAGIVCALMPNMAIQSFGIVSMVLALVNIFTSQALMRLMIKLYLPLNAEDGKKCNFTKEGVNND